MPADVAAIWDESDHAPPIPGEVNKFYELDGMPVQFTGKPLEFPTRWNVKTKHWEPFQQLTRIAFEATPLEKQEFTELCQSVGATGKP